MGTFKVRVEIADSSGEQWEVVEALVDTGATYTMLPSPLLRRLGIQAHTRDVFMLADGRNVELEIGRGWVRVSGRSEVTLVIFGEPLAEPLLGAYALEGLRLAADPVGRRLVPVPALLMAQTASLSAERRAAPRDQRPNSSLLASSCPGASSSTRRSALKASPVSPVVR
jgi:aspartyl protease family protein